MKKIFAAAVATLALTAASGAEAGMRMASPAQLHAASDQQAPTRAGTLSCTAHAGPERHVTCIFDHPAGEDSFSETYDTKLTRQLVEDGMMTGRTMRWAVLTPGGKANPGMLLGAHANGSPDAKAVKASYQGDTKQITFEPLDETAAAEPVRKTPVALLPSAKPVEVSSKKTVQLTVMR